MDQDLQSIASARRCAEKAFKAYQDFLGTDPAHVDAIVDAMARAVEPEAKRLGQMAVEETGYGNVDDKRVKNLFNALSVADFLRDVTTLGMLWRDDATKVAAFGEPMGVVAALIPVTNPTSTIIYKVLSAVKAGNAIICAPHPRGIRCGLETVSIMARAAEQMVLPKG
ncbi:MAG: aldehyde dehydrogenase family protein [Paracoccaceae bacterium]